MQHKLLPLLICAWLGAAQAAELGEIAPHSYIGQPLAVDIELGGLTPEEVQGLQVRLADANVYRGANVAMNPALGSVRLQVERRGARQVLHVTTTRAVEADYLHLFVELGVPGRQEVRLATIWLQRDPNPAPVVVASVPPPPAALTPAQAEQVLAQARAARGEVAGKMAAGGAANGAAGGAVAGAGAAGAVANGPAGTAVAAAAPTPGRDRSKPAPLPSMQEAQTGTPGEIKAAAQARRIAGVLVSADGRPIKPSERVEPAEVPMQVSQALLPLAPLPLPKGVKRPAPTASCPPAGISAKECVALDNHNAAISSKLTELEGKLKALQGAAGGAAPAAAAAAHGQPAAAKVAAPPAAGAGETTSGMSQQGQSEAHAAEAAAQKAPAAGGAKAAAASASATGAAAAAADSADSASAGEGASAAAAAASEAASVPKVPTKQVRVLPKLKYKKEKPPEEASSNVVPLAAGGVGLLALLGAGFIWWRRKKSAGKGPLKIWQGFRKKKPPESADAAPPPAEAAPAEAKPESVAS